MMVRERPAESVERRTLAERNANKTGGTKTQSLGQTLSGLDRVREAASRDKRLRFNNLFHHISPKLLVDAYFAINRKAASGIDGVTWKDYGGNEFLSRIKMLHENLQAGWYRPKPSKRTWIPKADGTERPIGIAALEDKIVQQALTWVLEAIYEVDFLGFSYGFRPSKSCHDALDAVYVMVTQKKVSWILDADIRGFFNEIDHEWLVMFLGERIADARILDLCIRMLKAGVMEGQQKHDSVKGAAQGSVISPLFANIYLHYVLDLWVNQWRKRQARGEVYIVRYADDFVLGFQYADDGNKLHQALIQRLEEFGLALHEDKTRLVEFGRFAEGNRKKRGVGKPNTFNFLGFAHICSKRRSDGKFSLRRKTIRKKLNKKIVEVSDKLMAKRFIPVGDQGRWLRSVFLGHMNYFSVPGNRKAVDAFRRGICRAWFRALRKRSQKAKKLNWNKMRKLVKAYIPSVKVVHCYPNLRFRV